MRIVLFLQIIIAEGPPYCIRVNQLIHFKNCEFESIVKRPFIPTTWLFS